MAGMSLIFSHPYLTSPIVKINEVYIIINDKTVKPETLISKNFDKFGEFRAIIAKL